MKRCSLLLTGILLLLAPAVEASHTYVVKKGDSLYRIAKRFGIDQEKIREVNNLGSTKLKLGIRLTIPSGEPAEKKEAPKLAKAEPAVHGKPGSGGAATTGSSRTQQETIYHSVKKGDTLILISREYSVPVRDLKEMNNIRKATKLRAGQRLIVKKTGPRTYTVKKGDTLGRIAKKFDLDAEELEELNDLDSEDLRPGQKLILEAVTENDYTKNSPILSEARLSEDIKTLAASPELSSFGMKERLILFAKKMLDIPYRFGGSTFMGIDCSGYVQKVFGFLDVSLPRTAREQFHRGEPVSKDELSIGDLVFFRTYASFPSHVGIYLGNNLFIHASSKSKKVSIDSLDTPYYIKRFIGAKRLFMEELETQAEHKDNG